MRNTLYILRVIRILAKHDALFFADKLPLPSALRWFARAISTKRNVRQGQRLANALYELGPTFIKLGQALSIRADIIGETLANDLEHMQDRLPAFASDIAKSTIEKELQKPINELYATFDDKPIAAASIAQVHFATTHSGEEVAVKILRPDIEKRFDRDIQFLMWAAHIFTQKLPRYKRLKLAEVVQIFAQTAHLEMDLRMEASAACELRDNFKDEDDFIIPTIYWDLTSTRVMTLQRVKGIRIDDTKALKKDKTDPQKVLETASRIFFLQVFRDGYFHADQHPGNVFISPEGKIIVIDFGIMGRIDAQSRIFLAEMLLGFLTQDYQRVSDIHFAAGYTPRNQDRDLFTQAIRAIGEPIHGKPQEEISLANLLQQMFKVTEDFQMETQPQLLLLQKTMMLSEGLARKLNPKANFWIVSQPFIEQWAKDNLNPAAKAKAAACEIKRNLSHMQSFIKTAEHLANLITSEGIKLHPDTINTWSKNNRPRNAIYKIILISAIVSALTAWAILNLILY